MYTYQQKISMTPYHDFVEEEEAGGVASARQDGGGKTAADL